MFINITDNKQADNKASSSGLVHYLEKRTVFITKSLNAGSTEVKQILNPMWSGER